jgi:hypothetical protein
MGLERDVKLTYVLMVMFAVDAWKFLVLLMKFRRVEGWKALGLLRRRRGVILMEGQWSLSLLEPVSARELGLEQQPCRFATNASSGVDELEL